jgi:hypothetical protein
MTKTLDNEHQNCTNKPLVRGSCLVTGRAIGATSGWDIFAKGLALRGGRRYAGMSFGQHGQGAGMDYGAVAAQVRRLEARARREKGAAARQAKLAREMFNVKM